MTHRAGAPDSIGFDIADDGLGIYFLTPEDFRRPDDVWKSTGSHDEANSVPIAVAFQRSLEFELEASIDFPF